MLCLLPFPVQLVLTSSLATLLFCLQNNHFLAYTSEAASENHSISDDMDDNGTSLTPPTLPKKDNLATESPVFQYMN